MQIAMAMVIMAIVMMEVNGDDDGDSADGDDDADSDGNGDGCVTEEGNVAASGVAGLRLEQLCGQALDLQTLQERWKLLVKLFGRP